MSDDLSELHYESLKQSWLQRLSKTIVHLLRCIARVRIRAATACPISPEKTWCGPFLQFLNKITNLIKFLQRKLDLISSYVFATKVHFFDMHLSWFIEGL